MDGRLLLLALVCLTAGGMGALAMPAPPPKPPAGWEDRVLPGFEPSLESVLARGGFFSDDYGRDAWKNWGPEPVEGFFTLYNDPSWEKFRRQILRMLFLCPHPVARTRLEQELRAMVSRGNSLEYAGEINTFAGFFAQYLPQTSLPLLRELAKSPQEHVRVAAGYALARLATEESLAAAREVAAGLSGNSRNSLEWSIGEAMGRKRAGESMAGPPKAGGKNAGGRTEAPGQSDLEKRLTELRNDIYMRAESAVAGGDYGAALTEWRKYVHSPDIIENVVTAMDRSGQRGLERTVIGQLQSISAVVRRNSGQVAVLARVAAALQSRKAVKPLQSAFSSIKIETNSLVEPATEAIMDALVRLRGDRMTDYFASMAGNAEAPQIVRVQALIALGRIGTGKSVAAFKRLRDAAYGKNGAPERRPTYTHGERMAEAAAIILHHIPGGTGPAPVSLDGKSASVSEDYNDGQMRYMHYMLHFRRFGDEWMLVRMESMPIP